MGDIDRTETGSSPLHGYPITHNTSIVDERKVGEGEGEGGILRRLTMEDTRATKVAGERETGGGEVEHVGEGEEDGTGGTQLEGHVEVSCMWTL